MFHMERDTSQRRAIRKVLEEANRPLGPHEVLEAAKARVPGLGIATVYRALKGFVDEGVLAPVELPGESVRYETAGRAHHHHFHCRDCQRVFEVETCGFDVSVVAPRAFRVERHDIVLYGLCADCARLERSRRNRRRSG